MANLLETHTHFSKKLARLEAEMASVKEKSRGLDVEIQAANDTIKDDSIKLKAAEIDQRRSHFMPTDRRIEPAAFRQMQWALDDKKEQLAALLLQKKDVAEHVNFLNEGVNTVKRQLTSVRIKISNDLITQHATAVAVAGGQSLNDLIACLVVKLNLAYTPAGGAQGRRQRILINLAEAVFNQAVVNLNVADFGIPSFPVARQKVDGMIAGLVQDHE